MATVAPVSSARGNPFTTSESRPRRSPARGGRPSFASAHGEERLAAALGWFSLALGAAEVAAPGALARWAGVPERNGYLRTLGAREIVAGLGLLTGKRPVGWMWARVAGDVMDLVSLAAAARSPEARRGRIAAATALVAGVTVADWIAANQLSRRPGARRRDGAEQGLYQVAQAITIDAPAAELYGFWRRLDNLPRIMKHVESVRSTGERTSHWVVRTAGIPIEWDAEIVSDEPNRRIAWRTIEGSPVHHRGSVDFEPAAFADRGTVVRVEMTYEAPGGPLAHGLAKIFGRAPEQLLDADLRPLKMLIETGEIATTKGQPSGRRPFFRR
jgi:uncharacterized membrane protein